MYSISKKYEVCNRRASCIYDVVGSERRMRKDGGKKDQEVRVCECAGSGWESERKRVAGQTTQRHILQNASL